ncbi:hypothetical protein DL96DRAFT_1690434 [Flagelloscypha sp. PMI_526]|nr:hypothetical protein DL96DRAFT_1690434 [Flagelloscypha sp. PMI_526]
MQPQTRTSASVTAAMSNSSFTDSQDDYISPEPSQEQYDLDDMRDFGEPDSMFNDAKGIEYTVRLSRLQQSDPKTKKRKNAAKHKPPVAAILYIHEDREFAQVVDCALESHDIDPNVAPWTFRIVAGKLRATKFTLRYSVRGNKDIILNTEEAYALLIDGLITGARSHGKTSAKVSIDILEVEDPRKEDSDSDDSTAHKKKKTEDTGPTKHEQAIEGFIKQLQEEHRCNSNVCTNRGRTCFVTPEGNHVACSHTHLDMWAAAKVENQFGVDLQTPPLGSAMFQGGSNPEDEAELRRRRAKERQAPTTNIVIPGLADLLNPNGVPPRSNAQTAPPRLAAKMSLDYFITQYRLSYEIQRKLEDAKVTGPHGLRFWSDTALMEKAGLELGELADVRDGEERWKQGVME